jgi:integrase
LFRHAREERYFSGPLPTDFRWRVRMVRVRRRGSINEAQARLLREELSYLPVVAALIRFLCLSGTRISEALGLRWRNCNLEDHSVHAGELVIPRRAVALVEAWTAGEYTTLKRGDAHERIIPLTPKLYEAFAQFKQRDKFTAPDDPVFASTTGKPLSAGNYLMKHLKPAIAKVNARIEREGLDVEKLPAELSWHWLRHTNASLTDQEGMTAVERQKVLGHGAASMTMHYSHAEVEHMREGLERVEQRLEGAGEPPKKAPAGAKVVEFPATRKQA